MNHREYADMAVIGCRIRTMDPRTPFAAAVAVRDGVVMAVGDDAAIRDCCDAKTEVIDGRGRSLVPGLRDSHQHGLSAIDVVRGADLRDVRSLEELRSALREHLDSGGADEWVLGWGLTYEALEGRPLASVVIDEAVQGRPSVLRMIDVHGAIASSRALELAQVYGPVEFPDGAEVVCTDGVPTGELRDLSAIDHVMAAAPEPSTEEARAAAQGVLRRCTEQGLTCLHMMDGDAESLERARVLEESGTLDVRLVVPLWVAPGASQEELQRLLGLRDASGHLWRCGVAKFFLDGVVENGSGWLLNGYADGRVSVPNWPDVREYHEVVREFSAAGFQCVTHAIGDAAVRGALDAYRAAGAAPGVRHRVEHIELVAEEDLPRFASEGVIASMQPLHLQFSMEDPRHEWAQAVGPGRAGRGYRCGDLLRSGATLVLGSDWPVATEDPRVGMAWARLRRRPGLPGSSSGLDQCLTGLDALRGYTTAGAYAAGESDVAGLIRAGMRADFSGFAEDPVDCDADDLVDLPVWLTVVDGRIVHRRED